MSEPQGLYDSLGWTPFFSCNWCSQEVRGRFRVPLAMVSATFFESPVGEKLMTFTALIFMIHSLIEYLSKWSLFLTLSFPRFGFPTPSPKDNNNHDNNDNDDDNQPEQ